MVNLEQATENMINKTYYRGLVCSNTQAAGDLISY